MWDNLIARASVVVAPHKADFLNYFFYTLDIRNIYVFYCEDNNNTRR